MSTLLSDQIRPTKLKELIGQDHLIGSNGIIKNLIANQKMFSMILFGKPGTGKTTLAAVIANELKMKYRTYNAVVNNKQELMMIIDEAKINGGVLLILDEIHRLNKDKQDILLPALETGIITLVGLTTSNPYYKINPAIRSRCQIFELYELSNQDINKGLKRAVKFLDGINIDTNAINMISNLSHGDMRFALNLLEIAYYSNPQHIVNPEVLKQINNKANFYHDHDESGHYDALSALQKSIRGSDPDAAIHYLARLIEAGDLDSIYRRLSVICYEDIGLANTTIGPKLSAAINTCELVGLPEARIILGHIVIEMALSPKSNSAYLAINQALNDIRTKNIGSSPSHIKTHGSNYLYPHQYPHHYVKQQYLPHNIKDTKYYHPANNKFEQNAKLYWDKIKKE